MADTPSSTTALTVILGEWLWRNESVNQYVPFDSPFHWDNLADSARMPWFSHATQLLHETGIRKSQRQAEEEIKYWRSKFDEVLSELRTTHVNVYRYTVGREPSPYERDHVRELVAGPDAQGRYRWAGGHPPTQAELDAIEERRKASRG